MRMSPHEMRESNAMHYRQCIRINHYELDVRGRPVKLTDKSSPKPSNGIN